ncbi:hypothetical protein ACU635_14340 [[Actinomadura] parvosata]|uniref:hypothetical protein n=1 Tax=[Actinomadura] parvosata TaxID=1955412 RepID=UPI00406C4198
MFVYHNRNTGQTVQLPERDSILDCWPNWVLLSPPESDPSSGPPPAQQVAGRTAPPPESANKQTWIAYAISRGMAEKDARALSKAALVEEFGTDQQEEEVADGQD